MSLLTQDFDKNPRLETVVGFLFGPGPAQKQYEHEDTNKERQPPPKAEIGQPMAGRDILVRALEREGVECIFAYPGGASMEIHQALTRSTIRTILPRHEQGGAFAADGYARATGKAGVCMATSGPGATNLVTAIADAYMDSVPLVAITGQVPQAMIGKGAFPGNGFLRHDAAGCQT